MKYVRRHYHTSPKAGVVYCCSSYELKACLLLDADESVAFYETQIHFVSHTNKKRIIDFLIAYKDGSKKLIEVKPIRRIVQFQEQINDNKKYASENGWSFIVWTEEDLGFKNEWEGKMWADKYLSKIHNVDYAEYRKSLNTKKVKKHYHKNIATDTVEIWCDFCKETHKPLNLTYKKNLARNNGQYICEKHGGFIAGSKPKKQKENPYAADGRKQCNGCQEIKLFECFGIDGTKSDGYSTRCKMCRAKVAKAKYQQNQFRL